MALQHNLEGRKKTFFLVLLNSLLCQLFWCHSVSAAFIFRNSCTGHCISSAHSMNFNDLSDNAQVKEIYGIEGSGWSSPDWNWGYAVGTGHDCAMICRKRWGTKEARKFLVDSLLSPKPISFSDDTNKYNIWEADSQRDPPFEEVKLVLALAWQSGRWDGSDGGRNGYGKVLSAMAQAERYEPSGGRKEEECSRIFISDMQDRFHTVSRTEEDLNTMKSIDPHSTDVDASRRKCAGLVLRAMGFVSKGL